MLTHKKYAVQQTQCKPVKTGAGYNISCTHHLILSEKLELTCTFKFGCRHTFGDTAAPAAAGHSKSSVQATLRLDCSALGAPCQTEGPRCRPVPPRGTSPEAADRACCPCCHAQQCRRASYPYFLNSSTLQANLNDCCGQIYTGVSKCGNTCGFLSMHAALSGSIRVIFLLKKYFNGLL